MQPVPSGQMSVLRNALIMPLQGTLGAFSGGVFLDGACLPESLLWRDREPRLHGTPAPQDAVQRVLENGEGQADRLKGEYLFGGYLFRHYGHFLIETLSRLYAIKQCAPVPIVFSSTHRDIMPWQRETFRLLGLRNPIHMLTRPAVVDRLMLASPGFVLPDVVTPEQIEALGVVPVPPLTDKKIWLSRSSHVGGGLLNERELEPHLSAMGWEIVHPQYLSVRRQIALMASSARVAGLDGSAFHTALLAREVRGRFTIFFLRNAGDHAYTRIAEKKGFAQDEVLITGKARFLLGQGAERFYQLEDFDSILGALQEE